MPNYYDLKMAAIKEGANHLIENILNNSEGINEPNSNGYTFVQRVFFELCQPEVSKPTF